MEHGMEHPDSYDRPLGDLLKELSQEISRLVRDEVALARVEMTQKMSAMGKAAGLLGAAAFIGLLFAGALTATIILAIHVALAAWLSALIVTAAYLLIAGILAAVGIARLRRAGKPVPEQTIQTLKEDVSWARHQARSAAT
jgi:uncharacterized membrane protein YqjE